MNIENPVANNDPDKKKADELIDLIKKAGLRGQQVKAAYEIAMGVRERTDESEATLINGMADKMSDLMDAGLPMNRIVSMIDDIADIEDAPLRYAEIVEKMSINEKGKKLLRSIIEKKRSGTLIFFTEEGEEIATIEIKPEFSSSGKDAEEFLAYKLNELILLIKDRKVQISFTE